MTQTHTLVRGTDNHDDSDSEVHCPSQRDTGGARLLAAMVPLEPSRLPS